MPVSPPLVLHGQVDIFGTTGTEPSGAPRAETARPRPTSGFGHTSLKVKCWHCIHDIAKDPTSPVARMAKVLAYKPEGVIYLCVNHAVLAGYAGRYAKKDH
jgi:hypothetical protein